MIRTLLTFFLIASFVKPTWGDVGSNFSKTDSFIDAIIAGKALSPEHWTEKAVASSVDLNQVVGADFGPGTAYAVTVAKIVRHKFSEIEALLTSPGGIFKVVSSVKTQRDFLKISETPSILDLKLAIRVPIFPDFKTRDQIKVYKDNRGRGILEWRQVGAEGHLAYNRGAVIVISEGDRCKVLVVGLHVIKAENRVPWMGRGLASSFAREHYTNYISALESALAL